MQLIPGSCPVTGFSSPISDAKPSGFAYTVLVGNVISQDGERNCKIEAKTFVCVNEII
jgi:hypothetical protein